MNEHREDNADLRCVDAPAEIGDERAPIEAIRSTAELVLRPLREPDYKADSQAFTALAQSFADSPDTILQTLADTLLQVFNVGSAGISLLSIDGKSFHSPAVSGMWKTHIGEARPPNRAQAVMHWISTPFSFLDRFSGIFFR